MALELRDKGPLVYIRIKCTDQWEVKPKWIDFMASNWVSSLFWPIET